MNAPPVLAITMGDPAGVGAEIAVKALARQETRACCRPFIVGDADVIEQAAALLETAPGIRRIAEAAEARFDPAVLEVLDLHQIDLASLRRGEVTASAGQASVDYVKKAVELALTKQVAGIVTGPINKAALQAAGIPTIGHTELLTALTGESRVTTMLVSGGLRVVHVTRHLQLREVAAVITHERVLETICIADAGLRQMGIPRPRLATAALNPHGGESGLLGWEEIEHIAPAVKAAQGKGIDVQGPIPADSVFFRAIRGEFDAVVAMYHDQGHIPIKTFGFERSVTVTLGLPIVRTSVDHGTAFDIAWKGIASEESMVEAIRLAAQIALQSRFAS